MRPGFSLPSTKLGQLVGFAAISGQRPVFACPGGAATCTGQLPPFVADTRTCEKGSAGPLCSTCQEGWSHPGLQGECTECSDALSLLWIVFGGVLAITGATGVLYFVSGVNTSAGKLTVVVALGAPSLRLHHHEAVDLLGVICMWFASPKCKDMPGNSCGCSEHNFGVEQGKLPSA
jgi:hypothetical protein